MKKEKILPIIITMATVLYLLMAPLLYQNYVNKGINDNVTAFCLLMLGIILFIIAFVSWITSDNK